jgi:hypothetical protein
VRPGSTAGSGADPHPDSLPPGAVDAALSDARAAQARFERLRRQFSPVRRHPWLGTDCDERVGRICLRYDEGGDWWPGPEDPRIVAARVELLQSLDEAARVLPDDAWILGQRVRYAAEGGFWERAEALARACRVGEPAKCATLTGFVLHGQGRYVEAEEAFRTAIASMDEAGRRRWMDPSPLLDAAARRHLGERAEPGAEAGAAALDELWHLADPLYLVPGNDRLTEHWSRLTIATLQERVTTPYRLSWGRDLEEVLIRFGWEVGWDRVLDVSGGPGEGLVGHHHPESRTYLPPGRVWEARTDLAASEWPLSVARPREGYTPRYAPVIVPADGELLRFPRGRTLGVVAVYRLPEDTTHHARHGHPPFEPPDASRERGVEAGLFLFPVEGGGALEVRRTGAAEGVLFLEAPAASHLASLEVWDPARGFAGRMRLGVTVPPTPLGAPSLSDLVLLDRMLPDDATLATALGAIRPPGDLVPDEGLVVGWEVEAAESGFERLTYRLTLARTDRGLLRRVGEWLGIARAEEPLRLAWEEAPPQRPGPAFRTLELDVPGLEDGRYLLRLELAGDGGPAVERERTLHVQPR